MECSPFKLCLIIFLLCWKAAVKILKIIKIKKKHNLISDLILSYCIRVIINHHGRYCSSDVEEMKKVDASQESLFDMLSILLSLLILIQIAE
jgi:hypothetical protein